ncbi:sigma-54-dependent Fis family transcriptional regulator [Ochrobactrum soli]|uniref:Sigma-54-dependent Fis family transcriptional regulator n=1 Tax=Ochrobactrum soli TaxID=2448455 RepID=A0A849KQR5_9HYPH|nr:MULTISPECIES: sigma-54 dependent transcriptional regulator [Brucella]WHT45207.1 sigma-54 dependent transcriptional regulator [Ochrobactrum sp. SSR]MDX4073328.1 sigma-54 dependent transcriptional regulator [Brucella sp. NBRC 113783]NNU60909.1 sigma-54-dependent Fis family transcriptional regulator [[Ochrobactrum] soli]RLL71208.1 sigma-54-dependent Fis family transcriptional regulator [[Ochrobactrum] soli]WHS30447.1 sigma-54 dependent transcriptional regulator [Brucella sp. NM4]
MTESEPLRVMLVDDDAPFRTALADSFEIAGIDIETHGDGQSALANLTADFPGVVVTDIRMPRIDGHAVMEALLARDPELPVILMTGHGDIGMAVTALKKGAFDFIAKPFAADHLISSVRRALEMRRLVLENRRLRRAAAEAEQDYPLLGETPVMVRLRDTIRQLASVDVDVLIEGETGTGKELVARLLHRWSARHARGFVAIDCAALPDAVADDVLFGNRIQRGRIADADRGTLFLDEIDSMSINLQGKLLRVVEERELPSLTGEPRAVNLRVIAAAKGDLDGAVAAGRFRSDLFYRLETVRLRIPPLRERRKDIGLLFAYFLDEAASQFGQPRPAIDAAIESRLHSDDWPGNVRELRNYAKQVVLGLRHDPEHEPSTLPLSEQMDRFEEGVIRATLERCNGDVGVAAEVLQLPRRSLYARLQRHDIDASSFRRRD